MARALPRRTAARVRHAAGRRRSREVLGAVSPDVTEATAKAVAVLGARTDIELASASPPRFNDWAPARLVPLFADMLDVHRGQGWYPHPPAPYGADMRAALDRAAAITPADLIATLRTTAPLVERFMDCLIGNDLLLLPTTERTAPERRGLDRQERPYNPGALLRLCAPANWCRLAAVSVPCEVSPDGLPIGVQFVGRDDATLIACAARSEAEAHPAAP
ncbi:amidase family protein [Actinomadura miaoliensis]|uniref:Amidase domain-containing protein n=1 Tax=Actinomadura miaoliensis TaxID=430685 RepID=A0ABP7UVP5_9ACTN